MEPAFSSSPRPVGKRASKKRDLIGHPPEPAARSTASSRSKTSTLPLRNATGPEQQQSPRNHIASRTARVKPTLKEGECAKNTNPQTSSQHIKKVTHDLVLRRREILNPHADAPEEVADNITNVIRNTRNIRPRLSTQQKLDAISSSRRAVVTATLAIANLARPREPQKNMGRNSQEATTATGTTPHQNPPPAGGRIVTTGVPGCQMKTKHPSYYPIDASFTISQRSDSSGRSFGGVESGVSDPYSNVSETEREMLHGYILD